MKILVLSQVLPFPLDAGPKIRLYYVLRYLAQYHEITLISFIRAGEEPHVEHLRTFCRKVVTIPLHRSRTRDVFHLTTSLVSNQPFLITRDSIPEMHAAIVRALSEQRFDAVHADQLNMAQYAAPLQGVRKVLDEHNAVWKILERLCDSETNRLKRALLNLEWRKLRTYETQILRQFDEVVTVTAEDRAILLNDQAASPTGARALRTIPICIDPNDLQFVERVAMPRLILFVGGMFYPPNVDAMLWFASEVLPLIERQEKVTLCLVGARPDPQLVRMAENNPNIKIVGYVQDLLPYYQECAVFVVPIRAGGGMRVKILDAWARGLPIVSTTIGCEGIEVREQENILIADGPGDMANRVLELLRDPMLGTRLAAAGRQWVQEKYDWHRIYRQFDSIYPPNEAAPNA